MLKSVAHAYCCRAVGYIKLEEISKVKLHFFSHDDWKSSISWAYAELRPVLTPMQQQHEQRRKQHWQQWWEQQEGSERVRTRRARLTAFGTGQGVGRA